MDKKIIESGKNFAHSLIEKENTLAHYGVKGMKWKIRKKAKVDENRANPKNKPVGSPATPAELDAAVKRFRASWNISELTPEERTAQGMNWDISKLRQDKGLDDYTDDQLYGLMDMIYYSSLVDEMDNHLNKVNDLMSQYGQKKKK